ncbi:hypothetical protein WH47_08636, partial [Habropoda laboriosa]
KKISELKYDLLLNLPYSLDLAIFDFHLLLWLQKFLDGKKLPCEEVKLIKSMNILQVLMNREFRVGIMALEYHWCIDVQGNYIKNEE